jgi:chemotaxis protein histidine kinase CheA
MTEDKPDPVEFIPPSFELRAKAGTSDSYVSDMLDKANAALQRLGPEYLVWVRADIKRLEAAIAKLAQTGNAAPETKRCLEAVYAISHDMKGQGGTFGYDLVTDILHNLCQYLENREAANDYERHVIQLHVNAVKQVTDNELTGDGGDAGQALLHGLREVVEIDRHGGA